MRYDLDMRARLTSCSLGTYRRFTVAALVFLSLIMVTGALVRLTDSGLGCPNWPSCNGLRPIPQNEFHQKIEFGNRMVSFPTLFAVVLAWIAARRLVNPRRDLRRASGLAIIGTLMQIPLGGITVLTDLHPIAVGSHFLLSILILVAATYAVWASGKEAVQWKRAGDALPALVLVTVCGVIVVTGMLTTAAGPHSGAGAKAAVPRLDYWDLMAQVHAYCVFTFTGIVLWITLMRQRSRANVRLLLVLCGLIALQITVGEFQYRNGLPWQSVLVHVATAVTIWITTLWIAMSSAVRVSELGGGIPTGDEPLVERV